MKHCQTRKVDETHPRPSGILSPYNSSPDILVSYSQENPIVVGLTFDNLSFSETSPKGSTDNPFPSHDAHDASRPTPLVQVASSAKYIQEATEDDVDTQPMDADLEILIQPRETSSKIDESNSTKPNTADTPTMHKINFSGMPPNEWIPYF